jgi:hypothetical protein
MSDLVRHGAQLDPMTTAQIFRASGMFPDIQSEAAAATKIIIGRGLGIGRPEDRLVLVLGRGCQAGWAWR